MDKETAKAIFIVSALLSAGIALMLHGKVHDPYELVGTGLVLFVLSACGLGACYHLEKKR